jgi:hypothetical protein
MDTFCIPLCSNTVLADYILVMLAKEDAYPIPLVPPRNGQAFLYVNLSSDENENDQKDIKKELFAF